MTFVVPPPPTTAPPPVTSTTPPAPTRALLRGQSLLIIAASTAGAALLLLVLLIACCCCRRGRRHGKAGGEAGRSGSATGGTAALKTSMQPVTISGEMEKKEHAGTAPGLVSDGPVAQTPVMWTASDILQQPEEPRPPAPDSGYGGGLSAGRARYNSYQTPYGEDMVYDGRSVASSQPSDSFISLSSEARHATTLSETGGGWPSDRDSPPRPGLPGLPQGAVTSEPAPGEVTPTEIPPALVMLPTREAGERRSAALSYVEGRKRRNVTQV